jgi:RNA polymerase-binding transcription factor DksA
MPLSRRQLIELSAAIQERRRQLVEEIRRDAARERGESYAEIADGTPDSGDESVADLIADLAHADTHRDIAELRELEAAAQRLDKGTYGQCVDCGGEIEAERLFARPGAVRCIACQRVYEKTHATPERSSL